MVPPRTPAPTVLSPGAQAWQLMWDVYKANRPYMEAIAADFDLTPMQGYALKVLSTEGSITMSELAEALACDASNVTPIVDRLEARGLVERCSADHDRRVKVLVVTGRGSKLHERLAERMREAPPTLAALSLKDQRELRDILRRALNSAESPYSSSGARSIALRRAKSNGRSED